MRATDNTRPSANQATEAYIAKAQASHRAVCTALRAVLPHALDAGDALQALKGRAGQYGAWGGVLRQCGIPERTAQVYMKLARGRAVLEANPQRAADLSLRGALALLRDRNRTKPSTRHHTGSTSGLGKTLTKVLRTALSLQSAAGKDEVVPGAVNSLNVILSKLAATGLDLHSVEIVIAVKEANKRAA